jgi:hypothetical protein
MKLNKCSYCGGQPDYRHPPDPRGNVSMTVWDVHCQTCGNLTLWASATAEQAAEEWNLDNPE